MSVIESIINSMNSRRGRVTYSMTNRNGPNSYDCSSAVYTALQEAGLPVTRIGNTETMFVDLPKLGWEKVPKRADGGYDARRGDITIWGDQGYSSGAFGHTGIFVDADNFIHCNYGYNGITINNHDQIWAASGYPTCTIYRYQGGAGASEVTESATGTSHGVSFAKEFSDQAPHWVVEAGDTLTKICQYFGIPEKVDEVARYNRMPNPNLLTVGQKVFIPKPLIWVVESGETQAQAEAHYGMAPGTLSSLNPGKPWAVGQVFTVWG